MVGAEFLSTQVNKAPKKKSSTLGKTSELNGKNVKLDFILPSVIDVFYRVKQTVLALKVTLGRGTFHNLSQNRARLNFHTFIGLYLSYGPSLLIFVKESWCYEGATT